MLETFAIRCAPIVCMGAAVIASVAGTSLPAQDTIGASTNRCFAELPDSFLTRVAVYLEAEPQDSAAKVIQPLANALTQIAANHIRRSLGARAAELPPGEPTVTWRNVGRGIRVSAHRDGHISWSLDSTSVRRDTAAQMGARMLDRALAAIRDSGEQIFVPAELMRDSLTFRLSYRWPTVDRRRTVAPLTAQFAVPVFSLAVPWEEPARTLRAPRPQYPPEPRKGFAQGVVTLKFVVDTLGRPEMTTVREQWPETRPRLTGELGEYYRAFVAEAKRSIARSRFAPARIGGCAVRQWVEQPFVFNLR